jgi:hypothetical protein
MIGRMNLEYKTGIVMKTTPTVYERLPEPSVPPIMGAIHKAIRRTRADLYRNNRTPTIRLRALTHVGTVTWFQESNDVLTSRYITTEANFRKDLLRGAFFVGDGDVSSKPSLESLITDDAVRRHRKLGT